MSGSQLIALINGVYEALKKAGILLLSQELIVNVHFGSNATRTRPFNVINVIP